MITNFVAVNTF